MNCLIYVKTATLKYLWFGGKLFSTDNITSAGYSGWVYVLKLRSASQKLEYCKRKRKIVLAEMKDTYVLLKMEWVVRNASLKNREMASIFRFNSCVIKCNSDVEMQVCKNPSQDT